MTTSAILPPGPARAAALLPVLWLVACAGGGPDATPGSGDAGLHPDGRRLFAQLADDYERGRDDRVLELGDRVLAAYPDHPQGETIAAMMIESAFRLSALERARDLAIAYAIRHPAGPRRGPTLREAAERLAAAGRPADAVVVLGALSDGELEPQIAQAVERRAAELVRDLDDPALLATGERLAGRALAPVVANEIAARGLAGAGAAVLAARRGTIGVIVPLTGRHAHLGTAYQAGIRQAVAAAGAAGGGPWHLVLEDSKSDPVAAALAARRLCETERCELLVGALLSATTTAVALVAERYGVPLLSPTATNERLGELGPHVLQTNLSGDLEADILARLACEVLLKRRFAVIRPDTPESARLAAAFVDGVVQRGGVLAGQEVFDPAATDFSQAVQAIRATRPEVLFAPASVDQMVLLGPQLDFYKVGALVLGPSDWNSSRLLQRTGAEMEGAICAASEVTYPAAWSHDFAAQWPAAQYSEEATRIARSAYLATRLALETMAAVGPVDRPRLIEVLRDGLRGRGGIADGPEGYAGAVRLLRERAWVPFPGELYREAWRRQAGADSLAAAGAPVAPADSLATAPRLSPAAGR
ncbi:MAG TPA: ABC transporter substrate-binding protein [Candidatus Krumholzibacteria bacterium]|nr:ABC transporter substrate-binding protein [Candidatus Krumholzibacteria bacterium]HPD72749.1 ABC transporter substrate-binding protein [Candidatus Krumholzibacteria bacterium]HRY40319.1 ABC transporter substrate-binding protein [Candidatus Krumholzibacteria bacterium]